MTTKGQFLEQAPPSTTKVDASGSGNNPDAKPQTPKEESWWSKASPGYTAHWAWPALYPACL
jgi:hypothetical protein